MLFLSLPFHYLGPWKSFSAPGGGGGGTQVQTGYPLPNGRVENIWAVISFEGRKGGGQLQTKNQITYKGSKL